MSVTANRADSVTQTDTMAPEDRRNIPEPQFDPAEEAHDPHEAESSLVDDVTALFQDGKTYAKAELAYQKTRARFVSGQAKGAAVYAIGALGAIHLALIALTVGLVLTLAPYVGAWLAMLIVILLFVVIAIVLVVMLKGKVDQIRSAMSGTPNE